MINSYFGGNIPVTSGKDFPLIMSNSSGFVVLALKSEGVLYGKNIFRGIALSPGGLCDENIKVGDTIEILYLEEFKPYNEKVTLKNQF